MALEVRSKYRVLTGLLRNERRSHAALVELQSAKLRRLVQHAYDHVPFYRQLFREAGVVPAEIRSAADLVKLPVIDKAVLRERPLEDLLDRRVQVDALIERRTSGSSGAPFRFFLDSAFDAFCKAQYLRPYVTNGRTPFTRLLRFTTAPEKPRAWFQRLGLMREDLRSCTQESAALLADFVEARADVLQAYPSTLLALVGAIEREQPEFVKPRLVFSDSELLTGSTRALVENTFRAPVIDVFGTYETDNIAYECREHSGYHVAIDCVVAELLADGRIAEPGQCGELVCTVLHNYTMPLIRYNLGDIAAGSRELCACGRGLPLMSLIEGRVADCVVRADGTLESPASILVKLNSIVEFALEFQVAQTAHDRFRVTLVPRRELEAADREQVERILREHYPGAQVTIVETASIGHEASGKRRAFVSEI